MGKFSKLLLLSFHNSKYSLLFSLYTDPEGRKNEFLSQPPCRMTAKSAQPRLNQNHPNLQKKFPYHQLPRTHARLFCLQTDYFPLCFLFTENLIWFYYSWRANALSQEPPLLQLLPPHSFTFAFSAFSLARKSSKLRYSSFSILSKSGCLFRGLS